MSLETLEQIGLSPNETKIYLALLDLKKASIDQISRKAQVHRRNAYDALKRLLEKGLAYQVLPKKILTYAPVHPDKLKELLNEKVKDLQDSLPSLTAKYETNIPKQSIYVYKGLGGLKNYIKLILKVKPATLYGFSSKGSWFDPRLKNFMKRAGKEWKEKKIKSKIIYGGYPFLWTPCLRTVQR